MFFWIAIEEIHFSWKGQGNRKHIYILMGKGRSYHCDWIPRWLNEHFLKFVLKHMTKFMLWSVYLHVILFIPHVAGLSQIYIIFYIKKYEEGIAFLGRSHDVQKMLFKKEKIWTTDRQHTNTNHNSSPCSLGSDELKQQQSATHTFQFRKIGHYLQVYI